MSKEKHINFRSFEVGIITFLKKTYKQDGIIEGFCRASIDIVPNASSIRDFLPRDLQKYSTSPMNSTKYLLGVERRSSHSFLLSCFSTSPIRFFLSFSVFYSRKNAL